MVLQNTSEVFCVSAVRKTVVFCNETKLFLPDRSVSVASSLSSQPLRPSSACKQLSMWLDPAEANAETDLNTEKAEKNAIY